MPDLITYYVGNRDPSITETLTIAGVAKDLTLCTTKFKCRAVGSATLLVDAAATQVTPSAGTVRYDPTAADIATGFLSAERSILMWWEVTTTASGNKQDMGEALIQVLAHSHSNNYVDLEEFKTTLEMASETFADMDARGAIAAASRAIDEHTGRRFYADADAAQVRYYSPWNCDTLQVDDIITITSLKTDDAGDGTFENTWVLNTDYVREPLNSATDVPVRPWTLLRRHPNSSLYFPTTYPRTVELTGKFGWTAVPAQVKQATTLSAHRLLKRAREVPFGVSGVGLDGSVIQIMRLDPDVEALLAPFSRKVVIA